MASYIVLNIAIIMVVFAVAFVLDGKKIWSPPRLMALAALWILTAIFDNLIIISGIVAYDPDTLLGLYVWRAPIEDFAYTIAAVLLVPAVWNKQE